MQAALSRQRYQQALFGQVPDSVEIDTEREVSLIVGDKLIAGTIDRLAVLMKDGRPYAAEIFDFKTDQFDAKSAAKVVETASSSTIDLSLKSTRTWWPNCSTCLEPALPRT